MSPFDADQPESQACELLARSLGRALTPAEDDEARRAADALFAQPNALELLREVVIEEGMLGAVLERARTEHKQESDRARDARRLDRRSPLAHHWPHQNGAGLWRRSVPRAAAVLLVIGGLAGVGARSVLRQIRHDVRPPSHTVATQPGQRATLDLPDGSRVILAPNSTLSYAISASAGPRELHLEGEAYFDVRHDVARPFRVHIRRAVIEDLGTAFVVRDYSTDSVAHVAVRSGAVTLRAKTAGDTSDVAVHPGEVADLDSIRAVVRVACDSASNWTWTSGRLAFDQTPLPVVLAALHRWYDVDFQLNDSTLATQYFTGAFVTAASLPQVLDILGPLVHARFEQQGRVVVVTRRPGSR